MAKEKTTNDLSQLADLLNKTGVELEQNSKEQKTQSKSTREPARKKNVKPTKQPTESNKMQDEKARPTDGKGLFELAMQMRKSGKQFDFSNKELALIYDYMVDTGITNGLTKAIEDILNRKGAQLIENPYKQLSSKTPEKYQWDFVNDGHAISWLQDYLDDNHKDEDGKYNSKAQKLLKMINNQRRHIGADNIEWSFRWYNSDESSYDTFVLRELLQKMQNKDETVVDDISALGSKNLKALHDNLSESVIEQENNEMKGIYRSMRSLIEAELRVRRNERAQQKKERKSQNNQTSLGNTSAAAETVEQEPVAEAVEETPVETVEQEPAAEAVEETPVETVEQEPAAEAVEETSAETAEPAAEATEETPAETAEPTESEAAKDNQEENENNVLITPHYVNASQDFFALSEEKQKEQINRMTAKDLVDWYSELNRSMYGTAEYIPTAQEKDAFYNMAFPRVCELSGNVNEKTADEEDLQEITNLLAAYNVDFQGKEVDVMKSPYFVIQLQAKTQALATRFPQEAENESPQIIGLNENSPDTENIDDTYPTDEEPVEFNEGNNDEGLNEIIRKSVELNNELKSIANIIYYTEDDYDDDTNVQKVKAQLSIDPWSEDEENQLSQLDAFFQNVKIEYDDEWHKDLLVRETIPHVSNNEEKQPYTAAKLFNEVYELAKEAAIQEIIEEQSYNINTGNINTNDSTFIHRVRQAVLDQMKDICTGIIETQISHDLVSMVDRNIDTDEPQNKEEIKRRAQKIYENLNAPQFTNKWQRIKNNAKHIFGVASENAIILKDSSIFSYFAGKTASLKETAHQQLRNFGEHTIVGKLFVKSKQRLDAFEAKLAKDHKYMNAIYTSAKMFTAGAVIGAVGGPVATAAWIGYNVAKADKAFYNEYLKAKQTGEIKNFGQFLKKNPLQSGLTIASNVGVAIGLNNAAAGGVVRMATGAAGVFTSAAKDFAKGDWRMGLTKIITFGAGYAVGNSMHSSDSNTAQNNETSTEQTTENTQQKNPITSDTKMVETAETVETVAQEVQENTAEQQSAAKAATQAKVNTNSPTPEEIQRVRESVDFTPPEVQNDGAVLSQDDEEQIPPLSEIMEEEVPSAEQDIKEPHAPVLNEGYKITLLNGQVPDGIHGDGLVHVTIEQSNNGVIETEVDAQGNVVSQRAMLIDENGNKHAIITENEQTRYMTPAEEKHFIHNISVQHPVQEADANTAELLNQIHKMPAIQDVEKAAFEASQQNHTSEQYEEVVANNISLHQTSEINQSVGLEDGQVREDGNQIVTISNNGFSICSNDESIAMVVKDGQIQGYHIDANGHQTAMSQSELHRQYQAAASQLRGTDYQNSEFAKAAHNTFQPNQHTRG